MGSQDAGGPEGLVGASGKSNLDRTSRVLRSRGTCGISREWGWLNQPHHSHWEGNMIVVRNVFIAKPGQASKLGSRELLQIV